MDTLLNFFRTLGPVRLAVLAVSMLAVVGFLVWVIARVSNPHQALLYSDLDLADSARIVETLEGAGVPYRLEAGGAAIYVPADQVARMRVTLAEGGMPANGSLGYEIFDESSALGSTNFMQNVNLVRAMEGELARTIRAIDNVKAARVHLVLPKREMFSSTQQPASASVLLSMRGGARLTSAQVVGVQHLIASAVPGLDAAKISIVDEHGTLLSQNSQGGDPESLNGTTADDRRRGYESHLARTIERLVETTVGAGKVRAEVSVDMDFDRINTSEEIYDPESQVVRSSQTVEQAEHSNEGAGPEPVTVGTNLPDFNADNSSPTTTTETASNRNEETVNYEISRKVINNVRETGILKRLSVAVLVDGVYDQDAEGNPRYQPRSDAELEKISTLVRSRIGFNAERGDTVEVVNMPFAQTALPDEEDFNLIFGLEKTDLLHLAQYLVLIVFALLVLLLVVRPILARVLEAVPAAGGGGSAGAIAAGRAATEMLTSDVALHPALAAPTDNGDGGSMPRAAKAPEEIEEMIDLNRVEGRVKASTVRRVGEIVEKHPEETLAMVRNWLHTED